MIRHLSLTDVGPARKLEFDFAPRLNILTGDNGLGKTFVLDALWWVITTTWSGEKAFPWRPPQLLKFDDEEPQGHDHAGGGGGAGDGAGSNDGSGYGGGSGAGAGAEDGSGYGGGAGAGAGAEDGPGNEGTVSPNIFAVLAEHETGESELPVMTTGGTFDWRDQEWVRLPFSPWLRPGATAATPRGVDEADFRPASLVLYARTDGSYAIWDSYYVKGGIRRFSEAAVVLSSGDVWGGREVEDEEIAGGKRKVIAGLIADWVSWQERSKSREFELLRRVLHFLSSPDDPLVPGQPVRVHLRDRRDIPTLATPYGTVPVTLASAGVRRAISLAYLLVWAWTEHSKAAKESRRATTRDVVVLIDEPELHLHPAWQRVFLPAVLKAVSSIATNAAVQVFAATHSPLVLASLEPTFDVQRDALFGFDLMPRAHRVKVENMPWRPLGDVSNWLTSDVFDLGYARSREAETALKKAVRALDKPDVPLEEARKIHRELHRALGETDPFWARWESFARAKGIEP